MIITYSLAVIVLSIIGMMPAVRSQININYTRPIKPGEKYLISAKPNHSIHLYQIIYKNLESSSTGSSPTFIISEIPEEIMAVCNSKRSCELDYNQNLMGMFGANDSQHSIQLTYFYVPDNGHDGYAMHSICDTDVIDPFKTEYGGFINSPNYPKTYPNNINCEVKVLCRLGYSLFLFLRDLQLEGRSKWRLWSTKPNDYLTVVDSATKRELTCLSGSAKDKIIHFKQANTTIHFKTDYANSLKNYRGFSIYYYTLPTRVDIGQSQIAPRREEIEAAFRALALATNATRSATVAMKPKVLNLHYLVVSVALLSALAAVSSFLVFLKNRRAMRYIRADVTNMINYLNSTPGYSGNNVNGSSSAVEMHLIKSTTSPTSENVYHYVELPKTVGEPVSSDTDSTSSADLPTYEQVGGQLVQQHRNQIPTSHSNQKNTDQ